MTPPLRIGLNLTFMGEHAGGVGRYALELPGALLDVDPRVELYVFVSRSAPRELRQAPWTSDVRWFQLPLRTHGSPPHLLVEYLGLPTLSAMCRLDVLHSVANGGPVITPGIASVVTLHDLIWLHRPYEWEPSERAHRAIRRVVSHAARHAHRLFAISNDAARDIAGRLHVSADRIIVTPPGVRLPPSSPPDTAKVRAELALERARVVLCVAQKRPYKNLQSLVRALPALPEDVVLVLPGSETAHEAELRSLADSLGVTARLRLPGWLSEAALAQLYATAEVFVLPSLIEGFGLPVLEAMARGIPVACSNVSSLPEVAGDAALLFDPKRQEEITAAILKLLVDRSTAAQLVARGTERVKQFTWRRTAEASLGGYREAIAARRARRSFAAQALE